MSLEIFINPTAYRKNWVKLLFLSFFYTIVAGILAQMIFVQAQGYIMVFFTVLAIAPFLFHVFQNEERKEFASESEFIAEYSTLIRMLLIIFMGMLGAYIVLYFAFPGAASSLFSDQQSFLPDYTHEDPFTMNDFGTLFGNNLSILIVCLIFSFIYGTGSLFIISWNASLLATAFGVYFLAQLQHTSLILAALLTFLRFMVHGFFEMAAFFIAGVAGSLISLALINHEFGTKRFKTIFAESLQLFFFAILVLIIATFLEIYVPVIP